MRRRLMAGNWKMNKLNADLEGFFSAFAQEAGLPRAQRSVETLFAAPFTLLERAKRLASAYGIRIAAQNLHWEASGAYTGEVSAAMLSECGVDSVLVGHSERRQYFNETDDTVARKAVAATGAGLTPIVCVGETLAEREGNQTSAVVTRQVSRVLEALPDPKQLIIAYEPVWAIGTGRSATSAQAQDVHALIRELLRKSYGSRADELRVLYGGSANPGNIEELMAKPDIDGALVGGASLKPSDFAKMVLAAG